MLLCLSVLLMACACAAETMEPPAVSETESQAPTPQFTLSEVNAESSKTEEPAAPSETAPAESELQETISMEESEIELEPIQPIEPITPEEKETTLEFLRSYSTGTEGIFLGTMNDGEKETGLTTPSRYYIDLKGSLYYYLDLDEIRSAETGEAVDVSAPGPAVPSIAVSNGIYYRLSRKSIRGQENVFEIYLHQYTKEDGLISTVQFPNSNGASLYTLKDGTVLVAAGGKLYDTNGKLSSVELPQFEVSEKGDSLMVLPGKKVLLPQASSLVRGGLEKYTLSCSQLVDRDGIFIENWYSQYNTEGDCLSAFRILWASGKFEECHYVTETGGVCEGYFASDVLVGNTLLKSTLAYEVIQDAKCDLYLLAIYPDRADLYRIDQGYTDIVFGELETEMFDDLTDPMEEASVGSSLLSEDVVRQTITETTTVQHVPLAVETVERRADYVLHTSWKLLPAHIIPPEANYQHVERPQCIIKALNEASAGWTELSLEGIPYCTGGMNGYETFVQNKYKKTSLYEVLGMTSQYGVLYCVGNILKTYVSSSGHRIIVPDTVGVDCSGFVGSTCGISTKLNCKDLAEYGHEIVSSDIQPFDIIIEDINGDGYYDHCYFYKSEDSEDSDKIIVCDCTTTADTQQKTDVRSISKTVFNRSIILRPYYTFEKTATHHRYYCTHPDCAGTSNAEASAWIPHEWEVPDASKPCERYCKVCNYEDTSLHAFTYLADSATSHTRTCTVCGCSETEAHGGPCTAVSATQHVKLCMACGYSVTENHGGPCIAISATQHVNPCMACGYSVTENHDMNESYNSTMHTHYCTDCGYSETESHATEMTNNGTSHWYRCTGCEFTNMTEAHDFTYTSYSGVAHRKTCSVCGYYTTLLHNFEYSYNEDGHWRVCTDCGHETAMSAHTYSGGRCTVCNMQMLMKAPPVIALPPEDEPLPVPEDQKATL